MKIKSIEPPKEVKRGSLEKMFRFLFMGGVFSQFTGIRAGFDETEIEVEI